jgi:hypothetical protein
VKCHDDNNNDSFNLFIKGLIVRVFCSRTVHEIIFLFGDAALVGWTIMMYSRAG